MRVIIIDDEKILSSSIQRKLSYLWYNVEVFKSCQEFYKTPNKKCDFYLIDLGLRDGNGIDLIKYIRSELQFWTPIIIISWYEHTWHKVKWLDCWADDYVTKPFSFEELTARMRSVSRRKDNVSQWTLLKYKDFSFDLNSREVVKKWKLIELSKKEKQVVEFFMYNKWKFVTKKELECSIWWEYGKKVTKNTINVTLFKVREKLWPEFNLETKSGEGYILKT